MSLSKKIPANMKIIASHLLAKKLAKMWWCLIVTALTTIPLCTNSTIRLVLPMKIRGRTIINILRVSKQECIKIHQNHGTRKVHEPMLIIWAAQHRPNGWLSCIHSFKIFLLMKPSYTLNEMTQFVTHFDVLKKYMVILKMCCSVSQIDDLQTSNKN